MGVICHASECIGAAAHGTSPWQDYGVEPLDVALTSVFNWLPIAKVLSAGSSCKCWRALAARLPLVLPPARADALLTFCLLEVLHHIDVSKLPRPLTAIYGEMTSCARRALVCTELRTHLEASTVQKFADASLQHHASRPHHILWSLDVKRSSWKNLPKLWKHFRSIGLIETCQQRWFKQIHHSGNTRTCSESLLKHVNKSHPLLRDHASWQEDQSSRNLGLCQHLSSDNLYYEPEDETADNVS